MKRKRKGLIAIVVILLILALVPFRILRLKDGGSVEYGSLVYSVTKVHRLAGVDGGYEDGWEVKMLGKTVYEKTEIAEGEAQGEELEMPEEESESAEESKTMILLIEEKEIPVIWEDNESVKEIASLAEEGLTIPLSMYGGFEQVGSLGFNITRSDSSITTSPGDIVLYSGNQIVLFYGSNSWSYTKLGKMQLLEEELTEVLGNGDVIITLKVE